MRRRAFLALPAALRAAPDPLVLGAYSSPKTFWERGGRLDEYGINAIFTGHRSIDEALLGRARKEGSRVFAEFPAWNGRDWLKQPENAASWPIDETGQRSPAQTWFQGICPTNEAFLRSRLAELEQLVTTRRVDGVWLDYLHWHAQFEDPRPGLPETCFNASCVERFRRETGVKVAGDAPRDWAADILKRRQTAWREWRCSVVVDFARRCRAVLAKHAPGMLLGNYQCAWRDDEHAGARRRVLGLDLPAMARVFDVLSPMVYHGRSGQPVGWVRRNVEWLSGRLRREAVKIWPIVQAHQAPAAEFEQAMRGGLAGRASGVMMFTLAAVAEDPEKMAVLQKLYRGLRA